MFYTIIRVRNKLRGFPFRTNSPETTVVCDTGVAWRRRIVITVYGSRRFRVEPDRNRIRRRSKARRDVFEVFGRTKSRLLRRAITSNADHFFSNEFSRNCFRVVSTANQFEIDRDLRSEGVNNSRSEIILIFTPRVNILYSYTTYIIVNLDRT